MDHQIEKLEFPKEVVLSNQLTPAERPTGYVYKNQDRNVKEKEGGESFHEKKAKNRKTNLGGSYKRRIKAKYHKPKTRGDKGKK